MSDLTLRIVEPAESELIFSFLTIAARMQESGEPMQKALVDPQLTKFWQGWQRVGDIGVVAIRSADQLPLSCAWLRQLPEGDSSYVADGILELAIGTIASERGRGIGARVLSRLVEVCRPGCRGISLSVRMDNPAARLYQRLGFEVRSEVTNRVGGKSLVMLLSFAS